MALTAWPLVLDGYSRYIAMANPDASFNVAVYDHLQRAPFSMPRGDDYHPWGVGPRVLFGIGYLMITVARLTSIDVRLLHEVTSASMIFAVLLGMSVFAVCALNWDNGGAQ